MRVEASRAGKTRRTRMGCGVAVLTALVVATLVLAVSAALFLLTPGGGPVAASYIHSQPGAVRWNFHDRLMILLLGRSSDAPSSSTDLMMLASYDPAARKVQMLSIPPNLWVTIPGFGQGPIGEAYADGGTRLAMVTVESVLRIPIPYYAIIAPGTLSQIVDGLGGVPVHTPQLMTLAGRTFTPRVRLLNGGAAVRYASVTQDDAAGVLDAMTRQQSLLLAMRTRSMAPQSFFHVPALVNALGGEISTNFPYDQVVDLARTLGSLPASSIHATALSYLNDSVTAYASQSGSVMLPDWQHVGALVKQLFPFQPPSKTASIEVVNGSGIAGQAITLASWLHGEGLPVAGYASGPAAGYSSTEVLVPAGATQAQRSAASTVAMLLQVPVRTVRGSSTMHVTVRLGRDYQDLTQQ